MTGIATGQRAVRDATPRLVCAAIVLVLLQGFVPVINAWAAGSGLPTGQLGDPDIGSHD
jgi:hypothetical protein